MPGPNLDAGKEGPKKSGSCALVWFRLALLSRDSALQETGGSSVQATCHAATSKHQHKVTD